jgi:hypothetical protein
MKLRNWSQKYLEVFYDEEELKNWEFNGGVSGIVLEGIYETKNIDGEEATDHECLLLISTLIDLYKNYSKNR